MFNSFGIFQHRQITAIINQAINKYNKTKTKKNGYKNAFTEKILLLNPPKVI